MDNASGYEAEVKRMYLPPYSPDLNPIEEFFAELKAFIKRMWYNYEENTEQGGPLPSLQQSSIPYFKLPTPIWRRDVRVSYMLIIIIESLLYLKM